MASNKVPVTIRYVHQGTLPPVFLAGSFSQPPWTPEEMQSKVTADGQYIFSKDVLLEPGVEYQYKFRLGPGDWWVLDETAQVATDDAGNRNNAITAPDMRTSTDMQEQSDSRDASKAETDTQIPTLIVEKTDSQPSYGDDFGSEATTAQKDAHEIRAKDAEPDQVLVKPEDGGKTIDITPGHTRDNALVGGDTAGGTGTATPSKQVADTADEVADTAAKLDCEPTPQPSSDEIAGRTGERRMSNTPINEVAATAAEVADSAAIIDRGERPKPKRIATGNLDDDDYAGSGAVTPDEDKAPLFAYECVGEFEGFKRNQQAHEGHEPLDQPKQEFLDASEVDLNDPSIEEFPEERAAVLTKIRTAESHLEADQTRFDGVPLSPVIGPSGTPLVDRRLSETSSISPANLDREISPPSPPLLDKIAEAEEEESKGPAVTFTDETGNPSGTTIGLEEVDTKLADMEGTSPTGRQSKFPPPSGSISGIRAPLSTAQPTPAIDNLPNLEGGILENPNPNADGGEVSKMMEGADHGNAPPARSGTLTSVSEDQEPSRSSSSSPVRKSNSADSQNKENQVVQQRQEKHYKLDLNGDGSGSGGAAAEEGSGKGKSVAAKIGDKAQALASKVSDSVPPPQPFKNNANLNRSRISLDGSSDHGSHADDYVHVHIAESSGETNDSGKSTGRDDEGAALNGGRVKKRGASAAASERPKSAQSLRPHSDEAGKPSRGWLKSIWQTVVVGWVGGIFRMLLGRRERGEREQRGGQGQAGHQTN